MSSRPAVIYVDVDETVIRSVGSKRIPMPGTLRLVRALHDHGATLYLWSRGGAAYAREVAEELHVDDCFTAFLPKPELLLDDAGVEHWSAVELHPAECSAITVEEVLARVKR